MKKMTLIRLLNTALLTIVFGISSPVFAQAQDVNGMGFGGMMNGWMGFGYNGFFVVILLVVVTGLVTWIISQKKK